MVCWRGKFQEGGVTDEAEKADSANDRYRASMTTPIFNVVPDFVLSFTRSTLFFARLCFLVPLSPLCHTASRSQTHW